ncbi:MAG: type II and III secretion system protein [Rhodothermales bacterium]
MTVRRTHTAILLGALLALGLILVLPTDARAQDRPSQRQLRTYVPPDQLVSFLPSTPFNVFVDFLNPIFERVTGKAIVDPTESDFSIDVSIAGMHFFDAFELVVDYHGLRYRETDRYFVVEEAPETQDVVDAQDARAGSGEGRAGAENIPASLASREIRINAVLFELNLTRARELGMDWNVLFGEGGQGQGAGGGGQGGSGDSEVPQFRLKTGELFDNFDEFLDAPADIELSTLTQLFRLLENEGIGETVANPEITVQSGEEGRIQIGSDVPVQIRDFSGNTVTQFYSTGIIINVLPTLLTQALADTANAPELDFIHLNVDVEKSNGRPSLQGLVIDRNKATTQVLLLDGEQTVIGGLYTTEESISRRGIPLLKDLPWWFFGIRYVFGFNQTTVSEKELLIVLQAETLEPLHVRADRPLERDMLIKRRAKIREVLENAGFEPEAVEVPEGRR